MGNPWRDESTLRELYHGDGLTLKEVAEELDTSVRTISKWMDKHGIERRSPGTGPNDARVEDPEWMEREYRLKGRSVSDLSDELGCSNKTILNRLEEHGIQTRPQQRQAGDSRVYDCGFLRNEYVSKRKTAGEIADNIGVGKTTVLRQLENCGIDRRTKSEALSGLGRVERTAFYTDTGGYEYAAAKVDGNVIQVGIHRLVAIADGADPHTVFSGMDNHVHHENGNSWDNRPENLEVVSAEEHRKRHS